MIECELTALYHMKEYWRKMITLIWPCTKISRNEQWRNVNKTIDSKVQTNKTVPKNKPANIIRDNEKGTCLLLEVAIFLNSVIFTFSVKGKKNFIQWIDDGTALSNGKWVVFCAVWKNWGHSVGDTALQRN